MVLFPFMSKGHTIPFLQLARLLLRRSIAVTFFTTPANSPFIAQSLANTTASIIDIPFPKNIPEIPPEVESTDKLPSMSLFPQFGLATKHMQPDFEKALEVLPRINFMVSDGFLWWTLESANKFGFPRLVFDGMNVYSHCLYHAVGECGFLFGPESDSELITVPQFPWIKVTKNDFQPCVVRHQEDPLFEYFIASVKTAASNSYGVIFNSFDDLESTLANYMHMGSKNNAWLVGPLCLADPLRIEHEPHEKSNWIQWLDEKLHQGSATELSPEQLHEIAIGLEESGVNFLWVTRAKGSNLGDGFEERVKERGIVVREWVNQREILMHPSVQGFLSHSGWNSVLESICAGVPILAWPMMAEQPLNARMIVEEIKIGLRVETCDGSVRGFVKWEGLKKTVKELMEGEQGDVVRENVKHFAEMAKKAMEEENGSSWRTLDILIDQICRMDAKSRGSQYHAVLFPFMSKGHTIPLLRLAHLLLRRGIAVTFFTTLANRPFIAKFLANTTASIVDIPFPKNVTEIPPEVESTDKLPSMSLFPQFALATKHMQPDFERALEVLPRVNFMVSDGFLWWTLESANKLGFPRLVYYGMNAYSLSLTIAVGAGRLLFGPESDDDLITVPQFPLIKVTRNDFGPTFRVPEPKGSLSEFVTGCIIAASDSYGVIFDGFYELEPTFADYWKMENGNGSWFVGPLCLVEPLTVEHAPHKKPTCIQWLDQKLEQGSPVLYVAFGSQAEITPEQLHEITIGLEKSEVNFLWVTRAKESELGDEFEERVKERGVVVREWVNQREILMHQGFLSHCGWNSVLESICAGVPILAWPMMAEQPLNTRMIVEEIKIGLRVETCNGSVRGFVKWEGLRKTVKELTEGELGKMVRKNVEDYAQMAKNAMEEGGSSWQALDILYHAVLFPFMSKGHIIPSLRLAHLLLRRGISITFFTTPANRSFIAKSLANTTASIIDIPFPKNIPEIPPEVESTDKLPSMSLFPQFALATKHMQADFEKALEMLPRVNFLVSDGFLWWTLESANKFGFPRLVFYGMNAYSLSLTIAVGASRLLFGPESDDQLITVPQFPWIKVTRNDFGPNFRVPEPKGSLPEFVTACRIATSNSYGMIFDGFYELEPTFADYWKMENGNGSWFVGPLCLVEPLTVEHAPHKKPTCIQWLDQKLEQGRPVLYVAFGSQAEIRPEQLHEITIGLEKSEVNFLWVTRAKESELGDEFEERVKERGIVVREWVNQREILMHPSIQGFLSHCGWNSVLESVSAGVPILCWPMMAEQHLNTRMIVEEIKIGLRVETCNGSVTGFVRWEGLRKMVKELMEGELGKMVRKNVKYYAQMAKKAIEKETGSSWRALDNMVGEICGSKM
ncbi:hypothetical protein Tsubulata_035644 [Turnera subulata]|uniref:anthocyanidin 3-O-glucosyltransferase n=1 Tax=Turnera subulata TaxID=218843 RepID=A0A9Q0GLU6_9ROSI|nr:hypothetical protein Tsubulata_035644 [Turnera subulata]